MVGSRAADAQSADANPAGGCERVVADVEGFYAALKRIERGRNVFGPTDFRCNSFETQCAGGGLSLTHLQSGRGIIAIGHNRQPAQTWDNFTQ